MKGILWIGMAAGGVAGMAAAAALVESMHPGMMARDKKRMMKKAKHMMHLC